MAGPDPLIIVLGEIQGLNRTVGGLGSDVKNLQRQIDDQGKDAAAFRDLVERRHQERIEHLERIRSDFDSQTGMLRERIENVDQRVRGCPQHAPQEQTAVVESTAKAGMWRSIAKFFLMLGAAITASAAWLTGSK